ncbi:MAG: formyl transferase [Pseudomonadota bacterium]|nr:formyl transferase [Pseudomonadota bacterium]
MNGRNGKPPGNENGQVVLMIAGGPLANVIANTLASHFPRLAILREAPESKLRMLRRRSRIAGPAAALGQALCGVALKPLSRLSRARLAEIAADNGFVTGALPDVPVITVGSVNSSACRDALHSLAPDVVAVYGTRLIGARTLAAVDAPFINYHAGITPKYRGQHPAYRALAGGDADHAGVTIHLVDEGVDTGAVLYQAPVRFSPRDNITTYQFVQMAAARPLLVRAIEDALAGRLSPRHVDLPSRNWLPPTIWEYAVNGLARSVW